MSLGSGSTWLITLIAAAASVGLLLAATRARTAGWAVVIGLIWGGAVGNLLDRLFASPGFGVGHVTDFLAYCNLFIGNLADRSEEHTSELQSLMRISYAVFCLKIKISNK